MTDNENAIQKMIERRRKKFYQKIRIQEREFLQKEKTFWDAYSKRIEYNHDVGPCKFCGSDKIIFSPVTYKNGSTHIYMYCRDCYNCLGVTKKEKNIDKRKNITTLVYDIKKENNNKCAICGSEDNIVAHHIFPVWFAPELVDCRGNLIVLCDKCHKRIHESYDEYSIRYPNGWNY